MQIDFDIGGPLFWSGAEFRNPTYKYQLQSADLEEIESALQTFEDSGVSIADIARWCFPLPTLGDTLDSIAEEIHSGQGFMVLTGLNAELYTVRESTAIYLGISSYIGDKRGLQSSKGKMLSHITSSKKWTVPESQRFGIHSTFEMPFHTDMGGDILGLQKRKGAHVGGSTFICSASTVFAHLVSTEPEVARTLVTQNWPVQVSGRKSPFYLSSPFAIHQGRVMASMDPKRFGPQQLSGALPGKESDIPELTNAQVYALNRVSQVARQFELRLSMDAGDLLFFNNLALLHRRDAYTDGAAASRHMVRLWLRNTRLGWSIPKHMLPPWLAAFGEVQETGKRSFDFEPVEKYEIPKYTAGSASFVIDE